MEKVAIKTKNENLGGKLFIELPDEKEEELDVKYFIEDKKVMLEAVIVFYQPGKKIISFQMIPNLFP